MKNKSVRVNLSVAPSRIKRLYQVGKEHDLRSNDTLKLTTICIKIIYFILNIHADTDVQAYLEKKGGTLFDLIRRAVKQYISEEVEK